MVMTYVLAVLLIVSAKFLDKVRLSKQIVESRQIYSLLCDLRVLGHVFQSEVGPMPIHEPPEVRKAWIRKVYDLYLKWDHSIVRNTDPNNHTEYIIIPRSDTGTMTNILNATCKFSEYKILDKLGFINHSAVRMWLGYELALMEYFNVHHDEFAARGGNSSYTKFNILHHTQGRPLRDKDWPKWVSDPQCHQIHRSKIYWQEKLKHDVRIFAKDPIPINVYDMKGKLIEPKKRDDHFEWYEQFPEFRNSPAFIEYIWY